MGGRVECRIGKWKLLSVDRTIVATFAKLTSSKGEGSCFSYCSNKLSASKLLTVLYRRMTKILISLKFHCTLNHAFENRFLTNPKESTAYITSSQTVFYDQYCVLFLCKTGE